MFSQNLVRLNHTFNEEAFSPLWVSICFCSVDTIVKLGEKEEERVW